MKISKKPMKNGQRFPKENELMGIGKSGLTSCSYCQTVPAQLSETTIGWAVVALF
jgi:hypothetical protein